MENGRKNCPHCGGGLQNPERCLHCGTYLEQATEATPKLYGLPSLKRKTAGISAGTLGILDEPIEILTPDDRAFAAEVADSLRVFRDPKKPRKRTPLRRLSLADRTRIAELVSRLDPEALGPAGKPSDPDPDEDPQPA